MSDGICLCGCGERTQVGDKGRLRRYVDGHFHRTLRTPEYEVDTTSECWLWIKKLDSDGYGRTPRHRRLAHRVYYERHVGPIPHGMTLDHLCRNRACVNPAHLEPVTHLENMRRANRMKLTAADAEEIRRSAEPTSVLSQRFGVGPAHIRSIRRGESWRVAA